MSRTVANGRHVDCFNSGSLVLLFRRFEQLPENRGDQAKDVIGVSFMEIWHPKQIALTGHTHQYRVGKRRTQPCVRRVDESRDGIDRLCGDRCEAVPRRLRWSSARSQQHCH